MLAHSEPHRQRSTAAIYSYPVRPLNGRLWDLRALAQNWSAPYLPTDGRKPPGSPPRRRLRPAGRGAAAPRHRGAGRYQHASAHRAGYRDAVSVAHRGGQVGAPAKPLARRRARRCVGLFRSRGLIEVGADARCSGPHGRIGPAQLGGQLAQPRAPHVGAVAKYRRQLLVVRKGQICIHSLRLSVFQHFLDCVLCGHLPVRQRLRLFDLARQ